MATGFVTGVFALYGNTLMPGLRATDDRTFVGAFQSIDRAIINPWFLGGGFFGALILAAAGAAFHVGETWRPVLPWIVAALVLHLVVVIITVTVNVPLNDAIKAAGDPAKIDVAAVREAFLEARWVAWNWVRVALDSARSLRSASPWWYTAGRGREVPAVRRFDWHLGRQPVRLTRRVSLAGTSAPPRRDGPLLLRRAGRALARIAETCFSTAEPDSTSASAMPALLLPCAISWSTSRSRAVRFSRPDCSRRERRCTSASTTWESIIDRPAHTSGWRAGAGRGRPRDP